MSKRKTLELYLDRLELENSGLGRQADRHMVSVSLIWPRPAIPERLSVKTVDLDNGKVDLRKSGWAKRILFKEPVEGSFGIEVTVTDRLSNEQVGKMLSFIGSSVLKVTGNEASDLMTGAVAGGLVGMPLQMLAKIASSPKDIPARLLGSGFCDFDPEDDSAEKKEVLKIEVPLTVPETVYKTEKKKSHGGVSVARRMYLKEGQANGRVVLSAKLS